MSKDSTIEPESTYPELEKPTFQSDIPPMLLEGSNMTKNERWMYEQMSILRQHAEWSTDALVLTHAAVRRTNGRLIKVENWKAMFTSWWALAGGIIAVIGGIAGLVEIINFLTTK